MIFRQGSIVFVMLYMVGIHGFVLVMGRRCVVGLYRECVVFDG